MMKHNYTLKVKAQQGFQKVQGRKDAGSLDGRREANALGQGQSVSRTLVRLCHTGGF